LLNNSIGGIKRLSLELGGNSPFIVWEDADINLAVRDSVSRSFKNAGQICNSVNRIYVHEKIFNLFIEKFTEKTKKLKIGNGFNENVDIGPMATQEGVKGIIKQIHDAVEKGAKLMWGGRKPQGKEFEKGYFFEPTILINTNHKMLIMKEESFGPVVGIMPVKDFEQVISLSNDTKYGLVAYAYTEDLSRAYQLSEKLKTGTVCINNIAPINLKAPYGGIKESGIGVESSKIAIDEYLNIKHICIKV
jgi:succinate-semialdehyde dehydrogenase/glutarate-semialdehyde dehydrogenase